MQDFLLFYAPLLVVGLSIVIGFFWVSKENDKSSF